MTTSTNSAASVGERFLYKYYTTLNTAPHNLVHFYKDNSVFTHGTESGAEEVAIGLESIGKKIESLQFQNCSVAVSVMDCQSSVEGGIFIMVIGTLQQPQASAPKKFVQSFFLAPQQAPRVGYYVHNDVFRFLASSNTEATVGAPSSSDSTTVPHASTPSAPSTTTTTTPSAAAPATPEDNVHANNSQPTTAHHQVEVSEAHKPQQQQAQELAAAVSSPAPSPSPAAPATSPSPSSAPATSALAAVASQQQQQQQQGQQGQQGQPHQQQQQSNGSPSGRQQHNKQQGNKAAGNNAGATGGKRNLSKSADASVTSSSQQQQQQQQQQQGSPASSGPARWSDIAKRSGTNTSTSAPSTPTAATSSHSATTNPLASPTPAAGATAPTTTAPTEQQQQQQQQNAPAKKQQAGAQANNKAKPQQQQQQQRQQQQQGTRTSNGNAHHSPKPQHVSQDGTVVHLGNLPYTGITPEYVKNVFVRLLANQNNNSNNPSPAPADADWTVELKNGFGFIHCSRTEVAAAIVQAAKNNPVFLENRRISVEPKKQKAASPRPFHNSPHPNPNKQQHQQQQPQQPQQQ